MVQNFWITTVGNLRNDDGDVNENGRMPLPPRALARLKGRYGIARECSHFNRGRVSLPPRPKARLKKDTRLLSKDYVAAGLVARDQIQNSIEAVSGIKTVCNTG